ncbi:MAG: hypothetical protein KAJ60_10765 [Desulfobulbaceae bacterium]|nr:hypothetical protein [Desulfobulbaceae bacterium]MCK5341550.1 hypothetical protein [Desulfobulbaceae bacterium]MCK5403692.1 hypothetical protein [Desulfobulbaceae bacterium]
MPYSVTYDEETDCIFVSVNGELNLSLFNSMAPEVAQLLKKHACKQVLNDLRHTTLEQSVLSIYSMPEQALKAGVCRTIKRALVVNGAFSEFRFLETVFINQGNIVKMFNSIDDAKGWLFDEEKS